MLPVCLILQLFTLRGDYDYITVASAQSTMSFWYKMFVIK